MKSIKMFAAMFFAAMVLTLTGCSKDPEDLIIGTWNATKVVATTTISGMGEELDGTETETITFKEGESQMIFKEDGTLVIISTEDGERTEESGKYTIDDDKISITSEGQTQTGTIVNITKKELEIKIKLDMSQGDATMSMTADMFFKKA